MQITRHTHTHGTITSTVCLRDFFSSPLPVQPYVVLIVRKRKQRSPKKGILLLLAIGFSLCACVCKCAGVCVCVSMCEPLYVLVYVCVGQTSESNLPRTASEVERGGTFLIFSYEKFIQ